MKDLIVKADAMIVRLTRWLKNVAAFSLAVLMFLNFLDVVGTKFFLKSIPGALNISEELMVFLTILPIAYVAVERGHIRITLLEDLLSSRVKCILNIIQYLIAALITGFLTVQVTTQLHKVIELKQVKMGIDLPVWPANLAVVVSFGFLTLVWLLLIARTVIEGPTR